jgi:diguanylate cyclase (GGDEF)-like protein
MLNGRLLLTVSDVSREAAASVLALAERATRVLGMPNEATSAVWQVRRRVKVRDKLTGLLWRLEWQRRAQRRLSDTSSEEQAAILLLDVDGLKPFNDDYGHAVGDAFLRGLARLLEQAARGCIVGRLGGDEFAVYANVAFDAEVLALDVCKKVAAAPLISGTRSLTVTVTGTRVSGGTNVKTGLRMADIAMHDAKNEGGNRVRWTADAAWTQPS